MNLLVIFNQKLVKLVRIKGKKIYKGALKFSSLMSNAVLSSRPLLVSPPLINETTRPLSSLRRNHPLSHQPLSLIVGYSVNKGEYVYLELRNADY